MNPAAAPYRIPAPAMDQFNYALGILGEQTMHFVIEFGGYVDQLRLGRAFRKTLELVPVLSCRFVPGCAPYWEQVLGPVESDLIVLRDGKAGREGKELQQALTQRLDPATSLPVMLDLISSEDRDTLCITVHHAAMDAHGLIEYAMLLASCYSDADRQWDLPVPCTDRSLRPVIAQFPGAERAPVIVLPPLPEPYWNYPFPHGICGKRAFAIRTLQPEHLYAIKSAARTLGATVNDLLLAAFFSALSDLTRPEPGHLLPVMVSMDMRRYLMKHTPNSAPARLGVPPTCVCRDPDPNTVANLSVAFIAMMQTGTRSRDERIRDATAAMRVHKDSCPGIESAKDIESFGYENFEGICERVRMMGESYARTGADLPFLGNIGVLPDSATAFSQTLPVLNAFASGIILNPPGIALGVTTFQDKLTFSIGYGSEHIEKEQMDAFIDSMIRFLPC